MFLGSLIPLAVAIGQEGRQPTGDPLDAASINTALSTAFTYQGNLKQNGQPVTANCSFQFSLWDATTGGAEQGMTQTADSTQVEAGVFTVQLDFGNQFTGEARWLETAVQCADESGYTTLSPRQSLDAVPYAIGLLPGAVMQSSETGDAFYVEKTATNSNAIHGKSTASGSIGVWGEGVDNTGVYGLSQGGRGVWGTSASESGVYGESASWAGVWGQSAGASGVVGVSAGEFNGGVYGVNTGQGYGVYGKAPNSAGVFGESTAWFGVYGKSVNQTGVVGESDSHDGVRGTATAANRIGVKGVANATDSVGVWGESAANTGVYGQSGSAGGAALWGKNTAGGIALKAEGNAVQSLAMNGLPKAMAHIRGRNLYMVQCYNGITGDSSAGNGCGGFDVQASDNLQHTVVVDFGFPVSNRFIMVNAYDAGGSDISRYLYIQEISGNTVTVHNERVDCSGPGFCGIDGMDFFIFVF